MGSILSSNRIGRAKKLGRCPDMRPDTAHCVQGGDVFQAWALRARSRRRAAAPKPRRPVPSSVNVAGSGTGVTCAQSWVVFVAFSWEVNCELNVPGSPVGENPSNSNRYWSEPTWNRYFVSGRSTVTVSAQQPG